MSSRAEEKRRRREEREAAEKAAAASAGRWQRLQIAGGVVLGIAAVVALLFLFKVINVSGGGPVHVLGPSGQAGQITSLAIPPQRIGGLQQAASAAGCTLLNPPSEGRTHVLGNVTYGTNPPSSGNHYPVPAHDGRYDPGATPRKEILVHALEHGRIEIQYRPGTPNRVIGQLQTLVVQEFNGKDNDPRILLFQNQTGMPYAIAAVAWTHILGCPQYNARVFDAIRAFRVAYDLKAPETQFIAAE